MSAIPAPVQLLCRQCSAPLPVEQGTQFVNCEYCGTTNVVKKGRTVFHYAVRTTLRENDAESVLRRWMAGNQTVKGLDRQAVVDRPTFLHFPMWLVRVRRDGQEEILLQPAAALSISDLKRLTVPAADLEPYDHAMDDAAVEATVPYEAMLRWLKEEHSVTPSVVHEVSLVHLPVYQFKYRFKDRQYTALVDGAAGSVLASIYPSKWEAPYRAIGGVAFLAYFLAALIPLGGYLFGGGGGLGLGAIIYLVISLILAIPIFIAAAAISARA